MTAEKEDALWWHMDALKTSAPNMCSKEAMFNMMIAPPDPKLGGECVKFRSYIMNQYLIVVEDQEQTDDDCSDTMDLAGMHEGKFRQYILFPHLHRQDAAIQWGCHHVKT